MCLPCRSRPWWYSDLLLAGNTSEASLTGIVVPIHVDAVDVKLADVSTENGVELQLGHLVEEVVEVDLSELALGKAHTSSDMKVLSCSNLIRLGHVVPLESCSDKVADLTRIFIITTNICRVGREPVVVAGILQRSNPTCWKVGGVIRAGDSGSIVDDWVPRSKAMAGLRRERLIWRRHIRPSIAPVEVVVRILDLWSHGEVVIARIGDEIVKLYMVSAVTKAKRCHLPQSGKDRSHHIL